MESDILKRVDKVVKAAGTKAPEELAEYLGVRQVVDLYGSTIGLVRRYKKSLIIGVNIRLRDKPHKRKYTLAHEVSHIIGAHLELPSFSGLHRDVSLFSEGQGINDKNISGQEKEANLGAADMIIDTESVLQMIGYYSWSTREYREKVSEWRELRQKMEMQAVFLRGTQMDATADERLMTYQEKLDALAADIQELINDMEVSGFLMSRENMAHELHCTPTILEYKMEALRMRDYDIDAVELTEFRKVFS